MTKKVINKYGIPIILPGSVGTSPERKIEDILTQIGCKYQMNFAFDETGLRNRKFDAAVFTEDNDIAFLIEYDGEAHYDPDFYLSMGNRECRNKVHVVKQSISDAKKSQIAAEKNIPLLRLNNLYDDCMRNVITSWVWTFVDKQSDISPEVNMVKMFDKYGWDFEYIEPSEPTKRESEFLNNRQQKIDES